MKRKTNTLLPLALAFLFCTIPQGWEPAGRDGWNMIPTASAQDLEPDADDSMDLEEDLEGNTMGGFQDSESAGDDWKPMMQESDPDSMEEDLESGE